MGISSPKPLSALSLAEDIGGKDSKTKASEFRSGRSL